LPAANATFSAEVSASHELQSRGPQADATIVQKATFLNHESQTIHALKSKLLSYEGNIRIMQSALDELRRQNIELVRASTQSKNDQVDDALRQLAIAMNQLREMQQQRDDSLIAVRAAEQVSFEFESKLKQIQSETTSKDMQIQSLEQRRVASEKAAETAALKLRAAADECKRLEKEAKDAQNETEHIKTQLQSQAARADAATAKWREAEAEVQQCRHVMQLDAGRLQVLNSCGASALCVCCCCCFHTCHIACVLCSRWVMLCRKSKQVFRSWKSKCGTSPSSCGARGQLQAPKLKSCTRVRLQPLRTNPLIWTSACSKKLGVQTRPSLS
jgi:hypothetical protein